MLRPQQIAQFINFQTDPDIIASLIKTSLRFWEIHWQLLSDRSFTIYISIQYPTECSWEEK